MPFKLPIALLLFCSMLCKAQKQPDFLSNHNKKWVDSVFNELSLDQKIGQLLMPRGNVSGQGYDPEKLKEWIIQYHIGGLTMFAGQPTVQAQLINELQELSQVPLLIGMDFEWGLAMRLDSTVQFPYQMTLGAIQGHSELIERMGAEIGRQCKRLGVHVNYAPVADINSNSKNPVISFRSFGENKLAVAEKALAYMKGLQSQHVIATAKHFPGHGDTGTDSHFALPIIPHTKARLHDVELMPFKKLIDNGLSGIMTAHLHIPALDTAKNLAATLSPKILEGLLRNELQFQGLTFTDAMDMEGVTRHFPDGQAIVKGLQAGNDILETFVDVPAAVAAIKEALRTGALTEELINARVKRILAAKSWVGLDQYRPTETTHLVEDLHTAESVFLNREFAEKSLILLKNKENLLPIKNLQQKIAFVSIDQANTSSFQYMAKQYTDVDLFNIPSQATDQLVEQIHDRTRAYDLVVIGLHLQSIRPSKNYGLNLKNQFALNAMLENPNTVVAIFGSPYALNTIENLEKAKAIIMANQLTDYLQEATTQAIFGAIPFEGRLPVNLNETYVVNTGLATKPLGRLAYGVAEQVGLNSTTLSARIDSVVHYGLQQKAYPGAVVQVAKNGRVIYRKAFGYHNYEDADPTVVKAKLAHFEKGNKDVMDNRNPFEPNNQIPTPIFQGSEEFLKSVGTTKTSDIFDFASVTKISTSALAVMQLMSEGKFDLDQTFGHYYPAFRGSNKENLKFRDMLTHHSGLKAWIPFWTTCIDTLATVKKGLALRPDLLPEVSYLPTPKRGLLKRLFGKKQKPELDYMAAARNEKLWPKLLSPESIIWKPGIFANKASEQFTVPITDSLWLHKNYKQTIIAQIKDSPVKPEQGYLYSDLHYYFYPEIVQNITGKVWEDYLKETYKAIGANSLTFNPLNYHSPTSIVPTEYDSLFRKTHIHGRVHDEGAAMLNGISGHAGLFGNANDLMKLMQLYLQKGTYGQQQFIKPEVIETCTKYQFDPAKNHRAIAFDKLLPNKKTANGPQMGSKQSYGHGGYTGTFTWIDPAYDMVYVFLSNRVNPTRTNNKISTLNIRTKVGNAIYQTIFEAPK